MSGRALEGLRVLEWARMISGPYCGKLLADLGAEVIKIEEPAGDPARRRGPFPGDVPHPGRSGLFLYLNTNKLGITLNLETAKGRELFRGLAERADVLIEDGPPGTMAELGLDYESLSANNPGLIVTSITPYGQTGPYRDCKGYHLNLYHASGHSSFVYIAPERAGREPPVVGGGHIGEYDAGLTAAVATMAAVLGRLDSGEGQHVDISAFDALVGLERVEVAHFANDPEPRKWPGMVGGLVRCKDGHVVIIAAQDHQWRSLVEVMGGPEWAQGEECRDEIARSQHRDEIQPRVEAWMAEHTRDEIYRQGQRHGVPVGPVWTAAEIMAWEQARERGFFVEADHPEAGRLTYPAASYRLSETPWRIERPAPLLGQHNEEVYCGRLGVGREELARLAAAGVV